MAEPAKMYAQNNIALSRSENIVLATLIDLADRELVALISWAKHIPGKYMKILVI